MESGYGQQGKTYTAIGVPWGKLYKRDFLIQNKLQFNTELRRVQDNLFNMYAFFYADEIKYIDEPLYNYRYEHMSDYFKNTGQIMLTFLLLLERRDINALWILS